jgi:hypothetical protein
MIISANVDDRSAAICQSSGKGEDNVILGVPVFYLE